MMPVESIAEAVARFPEGQAARIDWGPIFPYFECPTRKRYLHRTKAMARGVVCPEGRGTCYQQVAQNAVTDEWRAVCSRNPEQCQRRTLTRSEATLWQFDLNSLCADLAASMRAGTTVATESGGVWECGHVLLEAGRTVHLRLVVGPDVDPTPLVADGELSACVLPARAMWDALVGPIGHPPNVQVLGIAEDTAFTNGALAVSNVASWMEALTAMSDRCPPSGEAGIRGLKKHLDVRLDDVNDGILHMGDHVADLRSENAMLKQNLAHSLCKLAQQVDPEFFQWVFVILGTGSVNAAAQKLGIPGSTFADRVKRYVDRGGLYQALYSMLDIRRQGDKEKNRTALRTD